METRRPSSSSDSYGWLDSAAKKWYKQTPENFRLAIKIPEHLLFSKEKNSMNGSSSSVSLDLGRFLEMLAPIEEKVLSVVIEVPSSMTLGQGREWLEDVLGACTYHGYSTAIQFNHGSWYQDLTYNILKKSKAALVWSDTHPHPVVTSDFLYLRLTGGNNNDNIWIDKIKEAITQDQEIDSVAVVLDTPARANAILKSLGLPERSFAQKGLQPAPIAPSSPTSSVSDQDKKKNWKEKVIFCVDLNAFYPSCEELREPALKGQPHAVIMTDEPADKITKGVVSSCSYEARKYGVRSAMSLSRAKSLCPNLVLRPVDIPYYSEVSKQVMAILEKYADVLEQASIDEAFLDSTAKIGSEAPEKYAIAIKQAIKEKLGLLCSVGVAHTRSAAKIASDYKKPDGLTVVYPDDLKGFLGPLEVDRVAGIGPKTQQALKEMGIATLGQLASADVQNLRARFGKNGQWMWKVANGTDDEAILPRGDNVSLSAEYTLDEFTKDKAKILAHLHGLVEELYSRAAKRGYMFRTVGIKLVRTDFSVETRETSFEEYQSSRDSISSPIEHLLSRFSLEDDGGGDAKPAVRKVGLKISNLTRRLGDGVEDIPQNQKVIQKTLLDYC